MSEATARARDKLREALVARIRGDEAVGERDWVGAASSYSVAYELVVEALVFAIEDIRALRGARDEGWRN